MAAQQAIELGDVVGAGSRTLFTVVGDELVAWQQELKTFELAIETVGDSDACMPKLRCHGAPIVSPGAIQGCRA
jgi:hypothetical protein